MEALYGVVYSFLHLISFVLAAAVFITIFVGVFAAAAAFFHLFHTSIHFISHSSCSIFSYKNSKVRNKVEFYASHAFYHFNKTFKSE